MDKWIGLPPLEKIAAADAMEAHTLSAPFSPQLLPWQGVAIYALVKERAPQTALEIGTAKGYSASMIVRAGCPRLITLNPNCAEADVARQNLEALPGIEIIKMESAKYYRRYLLEHHKPSFDFIFVDGDHRLVYLDVRFFDTLRPGGLILFHDYTPANAARSVCPVVFGGVNNMAKQLGRDPDVMLVDNDLVGMAGFIRHKGESLEKK